MKCDENVRVKWVPPRQKVKICLQQTNYLGEIMEMLWNMNETRKTLGKYITMLEDTHN
jgi:hypothetical protein